VADLIAGRAKEGEPKRKEAHGQEEANTDKPQQAPTGEGKQAQPDGVDGAGAAEHGGGKGDDEEQSRPGTLTDLAKAAGMSNAELNDLPIEAGGFSLTLRELKARLPELAKLERSRVELDEARGTLELERVDHARRIAAIVDAFPPGAVPRAVMERIEAQHEDLLRREAQMLYTARPEWAQQPYATEQRDKLAKFAKRYGFSAQEIASLADHRMVLFAQDYMTLQQRYDEAKGAARKVEAPTDKRLGRESSAPAAPQVSNGRRVPSKREIAERVAKIMRG
jgi:hypothetical protein